MHSNALLLCFVHFLSGPHSVSVPCPEVYGDKLWSCSKLGMDDTGPVTDMRLFSQDKNVLFMFVFFDSEYIW